MFINLHVHVHVCHTLSFVASFLFHFFPPSPLPPDPNRDLCITTLSGVFLLNLQEYGFLIHCDQKYINLHERVSTIYTHTLCLQPVKLHKHTHTHSCIEINACAIDQLSFLQFSFLFLPLLFTDSDLSQVSWCCSVYSKARGLEEMH